MVVNIFYMNKMYLYGIKKKHISGLFRSFVSPFGLSSSTASIEIKCKLISLAGLK